PLPRSPRICPKHNLLHCLRKKSHSMLGQIIAGLAAFVEHASAIPSKFRVCNKGKERLAVRMRRNRALDNVSISHLNNAPAGCGSLRVMRSEERRVGEEERYRTVEE